MRHSTDGRGPSPLREECHNATVPEGDYTIITTATPSEFPSTTPTPAVSSAVAEGSSAPLPATDATTPERAASFELLSPCHAKAAEDDSAVQTALRLNREFSPHPDLDYTWVICHAREQFDKAEASLKAADEKATSVMGYLAGGAGIFTLGSIAGMSANNLNAWVAVFGLPSLVLVGLALVFAALARSPFNASSAPCAGAAMARMQHWHDSKLAEASLIPMWHLATSLILYATDRKMGWVRSATWMFVFAVICLALPITAAVIEKFSPGWFARIMS